MTSMTSEPSAMPRSQAAAVNQLKQHTRDDRHYTDKQLDALLADNKGSQRKVIERLIWNVKQARDVARERKRLLEQREDAAELFDRKLPSDVFAEATVLGTLIINPDLIDKHGLNPAHFMDDDNEQIFQAMLRLKEREEPVDVAHLVAELKRSELYVLAETAPKLKDLMNANAGPSRFQEYVKRVDDLFTRREMFFRAMEVIKRVHSDMTTDDLEDWARKEFA